VPSHGIQPHMNNEKEDFRFFLDVRSGGVEDSLAFVIIQSINTILSSIGTFFIVFIIFRSESGLSSTYHRIMAVFSIFGLILAVIGGLSYVLYPRDDELLDWPFFINEHVVRLGSTLSCEIQGAVVSGGYFVYQGYLSSLFAFYFFVIVLRIRSEVMTKWVEIWLHLIPIIGGALVVIWGLRTQSFNPHPVVTWCAFIRYPPLCPGHCWAPDDAGCECIRGNPEDDYTFNRKFIPAALYFYSLIDFVSIFAITAKFIFYNVGLKRYLKQLKREGRSLEAESDELKEFRFRKSTARDVLFQALLYILVLIALFVPTVISQYTQDGPFYNITNTARIFFVSFQGFLYFLIFLHVKVHNLRLIQPDLSKWDAVKQTFSASPDDRVVLVGLSDITIDNKEPDFISNALNLERFYRDDLNDSVDDDRTVERRMDPDIASLQTPSGATIFPAFTAGPDRDKDGQDRFVDHEKIDAESSHSQSLGSFISSEFDHSYDDE